MNFQRIALQQGLAAGGLIAIIQLIAYVIGFEVYMNPWVGNSGFVVVLAGMILANMAVKREMATGVTFRISFYSSLIAAAVASLAPLLFHVIIAEWINPDFYGKLVRQSLDIIEDSPSSRKAIRGMESEIEEFFLWWFKPMGQLLMWALGLIFWSFVSLLIAVFMKHSPRSDEF